MRTIALFLVVCSFAQAQANQALSSPQNSATKQEQCSCGCECGFACDCGCKTTGVCTCNCKEKAQKSETNVSR